MKLLKVFFIGFFAFIAIVFTSLFFLPDSFHFERSVFINSDPGTIFNVVANHKNRLQWSTWDQLDPDAETTIEGKPAQAGHLYRWQSKSIGSGELVFTEVQKDSMIAAQLTFFKPSPMKSQIIWHFDKENEGTRVMRINRGKLGFGVQRIFGLFLGEVIGPDFEKSLENLRTFIEANKKN